MSIFLTLFYSLIGVYSLCCLIFYWVNDLNFAIYSTKLRKTLYFLFFTGIGIGVLLGYIDMNKWQNIVQYMAIVIVIDIAVFETPSITKFANAEFKHNELITKTISENEKRFKSIEFKQSTFLSIVQDVESYFKAMNTARLTNFSQYEKALTEYLDTYIGNFKFKMCIYRFKKSSNDADVINDLFQKLFKVFTSNSMTVKHGYAKKVSENLFNANIQIVGKDIYVIPIFGKNFNYLIELSGKDMVLTDTMNVTYMANIFENQKG